MYKKKSWKEKLEDSKGLPKIVELEGKAAEKWGGREMVIPAPMEVYEIMMMVPRGKLTTINGIRERLAKKHKVEMACPLTTGIFSRIAAETAVEQGSPLAYWRTLKNGGEINEKYPGGVEKQKELLKKEGFKVKQKGKRWVVEEYEKYLI